MAAVEGGCLCGAVRYEYAGPLGRANYCHCADCRRRTGSAFNVSVGLDTAGFRVTQGKAAGFTKTGDLGDILTRHFCRDCGSPLFTTSESDPGRVHVTAGSLDDPELVEPGAESWTRSKVPWSRIPRDLPSYSTARG